MINDNYEIIYRLPYNMPYQRKYKNEQTHETMVNTETTEFALRKTAFPYANEISLPRVKEKYKGPRLTPFQSFIRKNNDMKKRILEKTHSNKNVNLFLQSKYESPPFHVQSYMMKENNRDVIRWKNKCVNTSNSMKNVKRICIVSPITPSYYYTKKRLIMEEKANRSKSKSKNSNEEDIKMFTLDNTNRNNNRIRLIIDHDNKDKMIRNNTEKTYRSDLFKKQRSFRIRSEASNTYSNFYSK